MSLDAYLVSTESEWLSLRQRWEELFLLTPQAGPPMCFAWMWHWWQEVGRHYCRSNGTGLRILTVRDNGGTTRAILPLYRRSRPFWAGGAILTLLGTGEDVGEIVYPEFLHPLVDPSFAKDSLAELARALGTEPSLAANEFASGVLAADSPYAHLFLSLSDRDFGRATTQAIPSIQCNLDGGIESYLARLGARSRKAFRRHLKESREHNSKFEWAADATTALMWFDELVAIHQKRWIGQGEPGAFASPRVLAFHRQVIAELVPEGKLAITRLSCNDQPLGLLYGLIKGEKIDMYQSAVVPDNESPIRSAGVVSHLLTMEEAANRGIKIYDLLGWESEYKRRFCTERVELVSSYRRLPSPATTTVNAIQLTRRAARKAYTTYTTWQKKCRQEKTARVTGSEEEA